MTDGRPKMKDIIAAFEARHDLLLSHLAELQIECGEASFEEASGARYSGTSTFEHDQQKDESLADRNSDRVWKAEIACHPNLRKINSDGLASTTTRRRRYSLPVQTSSMGKLPKLPLGRLSSDSAASAIQTTRHKCKQDLNADSRTGMRKSIPGSGTLAQAPRHQVLARRRSTSDWCSSGSRGRRRAMSATVAEDSRWKVKLHKRSISIEDDSCSCDLRRSVSRSSSSSGFSSQSSLL